MTNEVRLIDANRLMETVRASDYILRSLMNDTDRGMFTIGIQHAVDAQPTIDPESLRPKGRWVDHLVRDWRCSECGEKIHKVRNVDGYCYDDKPNYCPNCGAKMED